MTKPVGQSKTSADCYSAGERDWMEYGQRLRAIYLAPLLRWLTRWNISADWVTLSAGLVGLAFIPFWLSENLLAASICLVGHVLLDGLDGPLARFQGKESSKGSFTDTFGDQLVVAGVATAWMVSAASPINIFAGSIYILLYTLVVAISMVRNALQVPYSWLIRPRFYVFAVIVWDGWAGSSWTVWGLAICNLLLAMKLVTGFFKLRNAIP